MVSLFVLSPFSTLWMQDGRVADGFGKAKTLTAAFKLIVVFLCFLAMRHGVLPLFGRWGLFAMNVYKNLLQNRTYHLALRNHTFCVPIGMVLPCQTIRFAM